MANIGFIGLGIMGMPMAGHLIAAGHQLFVSSRSARAAEAVALGATACDGNAAIARAADIIITMVPDTPEVEQVLFGADGVAEGLSPGKLVIDMSSISPLATKDFAARIAALGADYVDAPVSGGEVGAKAATLTIMAGGGDAAFARALPLFEAMGKNITHVGGSGAGQTAKVANQIIVALNIAAVGEALLFAAKAGADPAKVREALLGGFASSRVLEVHGERMLKRSFTPGFRIDLHHKDLALALSGANALGLPLPQTAFCQQLLNSARGNGEGGLDHSAIVRQLERLAGHSLGDE
ncbi:2-hydroxy-3-oxopropionate reductase [Sphingomonas canadensis]|uniref:2-hydroxy-3-oxopropionate reductase n=1 Tax=Sphingomonas canadensis TaxID=1219257 RepID=A0ABW3HDU2_9SPHN|nr:2-hydroxy-3-oxopropionate reductase [Sphingomonas canadensis]MCW3838300.1 2-hydroxy-3-oxopropionate reductase [Sphingomonas canadensis]